MTDLGLWSGRPLAGSFAQIYVERWTKWVYGRFLRVRDSEIPVRAQLEWGPLLKRNKWKWPRGLDSTEEL